MFPFFRTLEPPLTALLPPSPNAFLDDEPHIRIVDVSPECGLELPVPGRAGIVTQAGDLAEEDRAVPDRVQFLTTAVKVDPGYKARRVQNAGNQKEISTLINSESSLSVPLPRKVHIACSSQRQRKQD
jgi:hypothetical protein